MGTKSKPWAKGEVEVGIDLARSREPLSTGMPSCLQELWEWRLTELMHQRQQMEQARAAHRDLDVTYALTQALS